MECYFPVKPLKLLKLKNSDYEEFFFVQLILERKNKVHYHQKVRNERTYLFTSALSLHQGISFTIELYTASWVIKKISSAGRYFNKEANHFIG